MKTNKMKAWMVGAILIAPMMGAGAAEPGKPVNPMKAGKWESLVEMVANGKPQGKQAVRSGCIKQDWIDGQKFFEPSSRMPIAEAKSCLVEGFKKESMASGIRASWKTVCKLNMDGSATIDFLNEISEKNVVISSSMSAKMGQAQKSMSFKTIMKRVGECSESDPLLFSAVPAKK